jgi:hypothetical protein
MAYQTGTANDYRDLLDKLRTFVVANGWQIKRWEQKEEDELILQGPGSAGKDQIFVGIKTYSDKDQDYFNWRLQGMIGFDSNFAFDEQPGAIPSIPPAMALWNKSIPYWLVVNARRFVLVTKISTVYMGLYLGFLKVYGSPGQYPYPLMVGGSLAPIANKTIERWSDENGALRCFVDPGTNNNTNASLVQRKLDGHWQYYANRNYRENYAYGGTFFHNTWPACKNTVEKVREGLGGEHVLFPITLIEQFNVSKNTEHNTWGELEGCFHVSGFGISAEDTLTVSGKTYLLIPNVYRTGINDYWALLLA